MLPSQLLELQSCDLFFLIDKLLLLFGGDSADSALRLTDTQLLSDQETGADQEGDDVWTFFRRRRSANSKEILESKHSWQIKR